MTDSAVLARDAPRFIESPTGRIDKYPRSRWRRWALRFLIAGLYAVIAVRYDVASGGDWSGTANAALAERVDSIDWGGSGVDVISSLYPPISSLIAIVIPGGALGLAIAGSLVAGLMLQLIIQSMKRKHFGLPVRLIFVAALGLSPSFAYIVTTNFEAALGLMFFGLGMVDLVRFVTYANTQAGFRAGILFACSAFSDTTGLFAAIVAAFAGMLIIQSRSGARLANAVVVVFPTIAVFGALMLLGIAFGGSPLATVRGDLSWSPERAEIYASLLLSFSGLLYLAPTIIVLLTAVLLGYWRVGLVAVMLTATTGLAFILGLTPPGTAGNSFVMMLLLAIAIVPTATARKYAVLTSTTALLLYAAGWAGASQQVVFTSWLGTLTGGAP